MAEHLQQRVIGEGDVTESQIEHIQIRRHGGDDALQQPTMLIQRLLHLAALLLGAPHVGHVVYDAEHTGDDAVFEEWCIRHEHMGQRAIGTDRTRLVRRLLTAERTIDLHHGAFAVLRRGESRQSPIAQLHVGVARDAACGGIHAHDVGVPIEYED